MTATVLGSASSGTLATCEDRRDGGREQEASAERDRDGAPSPGAQVRKRPTSRRCGDLRILVEDRPLELLKLGSGVEAELAIGARRASR